MSKKKKTNEAPLTEEQIKQILERIIKDSDQSIIRYINTAEKSKRKTTTYRVCPMCDRAVGNFGTNFKNHFRKCCPVIYDELTKHQPLYFGTWNQLIENGLIKGKVIQDDEELEIELRRTSNYHELCKEEGISPTVADGEDVSDEDDDNLKKFMKSIAKEQKKSSRSRSKKKKVETPSSPSSSMAASTPATPRTLDTQNITSPSLATPASSLFLPLNTPASPSIGLFSPAVTTPYSSKESWFTNPDDTISRSVEDIRSLTVTSKELDLGDEEFSMLKASLSISKIPALSVSETHDETVYNEALQRYLRNNSYIHEIFFGEINHGEEYDECEHVERLTKNLEKMIEHNSNELERDEKIIDTFVSTQNDFYSTINSIHCDTSESELKDKKRILSQILSKQHYHSQSAKKPKQEVEKPKQLIEL
ncbi:predicted protein [Naegleria gruberi]|uniref:Predicted protein n=1 Tax=Naegleria gruberi TaxID=5762 RepID=D2VUX1_NAEGR|nr:uncharacterized protein NAEGRDRAFT_72815 [Naegleria gruberi]EFC39393.1 predicted protein [Naegleria gruberi]|eukprot:XP_002672137.1 predicted protein [Naegleria gruberi strain NEG-M]